jgi:hypothetical protein
LKLGERINGYGEETERKKRNMIRVSYGSTCDDSGRRGSGNVLVKLEKVNVFRMGYKLKAIEERVRWRVTKAGVRGRDGEETKTQTGVGVTGG